jgi:hypothetical protein
MRNNMQLVALSAMILLGACSEDTVATSPLGAPSVLLAKSAAPIPLSVTVQDVGTRLTSDGGGAYVDGTQGITAQIDGFGNLKFESTASATPLRTLNFDFSAPSNPANSFSPSTSGQRFFRILTNPNTANGAPKISDLVPSASACYYATAAYQTATTGNQAWFNLAHDPQSVPVTVRRDASAQWSMFSGCGIASGGVAGVWTLDLTVRRSTAVFRGYYDMGFSFTLTAQ